MRKGLKDPVWDRIFAEIINSFALVRKKICEIRKILKYILKSPVEDVTFTNIVDLNILIEKKISKAIKLLENIKNSITSNKLTRTFAKIVDQNALTRKNVFEIRKTLKKTSGVLVWSKALANLFVNVIG